MVLLLQITAQEVWIQSSKQDSSERWEREREREREVVCLQFNVIKNNIIFCEEIQRKKAIVYNITVYSGEEKALK